MRALTSPTASPQLVWLPEEDASLRVRATNQDQEDTEGVVYWSRAHRHVRIRFEGGSDHFFFRFLITGARRVKLSVAEDRDVGQKRPEYAAIENVHELLQLHLEQGDDAPPILVRAKPGTGKTWTSRQLVRSLAVDPRQRALPCDERLVPLLIFVQKLSHELRVDDTSAGLRVLTTAISMRRTAYAWLTITLLTCSSRRSARARQSARRLSPCISVIRCRGPCAPSRKQPRRLRVTRRRWRRGDSSP